MDTEAIATLDDLIHLDTDAIHAYREAIAACSVAEVKSQLTSFLGDHQRHVAELESAVRALGGLPASGQDIKGFFIEGFTAIISQGDHSALLAMRGNEEITTRLYDAARRANVTAEVKQLLEKNYADEARHLAWIKDAIARKVWETGSGRAA
jgi:uncharacterized protein (TIGR02284 family)